MSNLRTKDGWGTYKERNTDGKSYRGLQVAFDPFFKFLCEVMKKNGYMRLVFNRTANLPDVVSE